MPYSEHERSEYVADCATRLKKPTEAVKLFVTSRQADCFNPSGRLLRCLFFMGVVQHLNQAIFKLKTLLQLSAQLFQLYLQ